MPMTRITSSGPDWIAALAGGLNGLSRGIGDMQDDEERRKEREEALALQREQLAASMQARADATARQRREDDAKAQDEAGKQLDRGRLTYGTDQDVPDAMAALAQRAGRPGDLVTRPVDPQLRAGLAATGASTLPTPSTRFVPTAAEREQRTTRNQVQQIADSMRSSNPAAATALDLGTATGKYPAMGPDALRPPMSAAQKQEQAVQTAVATGQAMLPIRRAEAQQRADIEAAHRPPKNPGSDLSPGQATMAGRLADDYTRDAKPYSDRALAFDTISAVAKDPSPAGDISLVFSFMKMVDPGSTVRESEQADARNAAGVPDQIRNMYNRVLTGQRLTPDQRADFVKRAGTIYQSAKARQDRITAAYTDRAKRIGVDPSMVIMDYGAMSTVPDAGATPPAANPAAPPSAGAKAPAFTVGQSVTLKDGRKITVKHVYPDGTFD